MCGLIGFIGRTNHSSIKKLGLDMVSTIKHRGPDSFGVWCDDEANICLAHQRLAIQDLSISGQQPMVSNSGQFIIVFNGEIYNHFNLRKHIEKECKQISWKGNSDTETLLFCIEKWGLENTLQLCEGQFAFAIWDREKKVLSLARDRFGEKPMYYGWQNNIFLFGSDLRALKIHPAFVGNINRQALNEYISCGFVPNEMSIYENIFKLAPGCIGNLEYRGRPTNIRIKQYWSLENTIERNRKKQSQLDELETVNKIEKLLHSSIKQQLISDVSVGAFLSGGIDSTTIVAMMNDISRERINTFTIGFHESDFDEANHARALSSELQTNHTELYVSSKDALNVIPDIPNIYSEPFADASQIPTYLISKLAKSKITVALSGDGGDELFGGYNRHIYAAQWWSIINSIPFSIRKNIGSLLDNVPIKYPEFIKPGSADMISKISGALKVEKTEDLYNYFIRQTNGNDKIVINCNVLKDQNNLMQKNYLSTAEKLMASDMQRYLPDGVLCKVDRASMACSLETRAPFLDLKLFEFAWQIPLSMKIKKNKGKWVLRQLLSKYVDPSFFDRPKKGFSVPIGNWLRGPLHDWAADLLNPSRLSQEGYLNSLTVDKIWREHTNGNKNSQNCLWNILMFQAWLEKEKNG